MKGFLKKIVVLQLAGAMVFIALAGITVSASTDTVTIDGIEYTLTSTTPYYIVVPECIEIGESASVYIAGRIRGSVTLKAPSTINLYNLADSSQSSPCAITMGTNNALTLSGTGELGQVSCEIEANFTGNSPRFGSWKGNLNYTVIQNLAKDISGYLNYALSGDGQYYTITGVNDTSMFDYCNNNVYLPAEYNGKPVKAIGTYAFAASSGKTCNSVAYHKRNVTFTIPASIEEIGDRAFTYFGDKNTCFIFLGSGLKKIGKSAFERCWFTSFSIPDSVIELGDDAFAYCNYLTSIVLPPNLQVLSKNSFNYCSALAGTINVPSTVTSVGMNIFQNTKISSVVWNASTAEVPYACFKNCSSLTSFEFGPNAMTKVSSIGRYALSGTKVTRINCPQGTTYASDSLPKNCTVTFV